jgi:predicted GNAT family N-acyltransferase
MNTWLQDRSQSSEGRHARTYVACEGNVVVGYYCISTASVEYTALPNKLKRERGQPSQTPLAIIGRLARDVRYRGTGLGQDLLFDAFKRIISVSETIGMRCVLVHAIDDKALAFYKQYGFVEAPVSPRTLYLPLETAIAAVSAAMVKKR